MKAYDAQGMLKSERKIRAVIRIARRCQRVSAEFGCFCEYLSSMRMQTLIDSLNDGR